MVNMGTVTKVWRFGGIRYLFLDIVLHASLVPSSSDTLSHSGYPVGIGVMGWPVGDDSHRSAVNEYRIIKNCGS